jgi:hypothetical protein
LYPGSGEALDTIPLPAVIGWSRSGDRGYKFADPARASGGVGALRLVTGAGGRASVLVRARGINLPEGLLPAAAYTIQLVDPRADLCWGSAFPSGVVRPGTFKAKFRP